MGDTILRKIIVIGQADRRRNKKLNKNYLRLIDNNVRTVQLDTIRIIEDKVDTANKELTKTQNMSKQTLLQC